MTTVEHLTIITLIAFAVICILCFVATIIDNAINTRYYYSIDERCHLITAEEIRHMLENKKDIKRKKNRYEAKDESYDIL